MSGLSFQQTFEKCVRTRALCYIAMSDCKGKREEAGREEAWYRRFLFFLVLQMKHPLVSARLDVGYKALLPVHHLRSAPARRSIRPHARACLRPPHLLRSGIEMIDRQT